MDTHRPVCSGCPGRWGCCPSQCPVCLLCAWLCAPSGHRPTLCCPWRPPPGCADLQVEPDPAVDSQPPAPCEVSFCGSGASQSVVQRRRGSILSPTWAQAGLDSVPNPSLPPGAARGGACEHPQGEVTREPHCGPSVAPVPHPRSRWLAPWSPSHLPVPVVSPALMPCCTQSEGRSHPSLLAQLSWDHG